MIAFRKSHRVVLGFLVALFPAMQAFAAENPSDKPAIPTLDEMSGDWCKAENILNPPTVNNRRDMIQVTYDLLGTRFNPRGAMMPQTATAVPLASLTVEGNACPAEEMRWRAYEACRRNSNCSGLEVQTRVRMVQEDQAFLTEISFHNASDKPLSRAIQVNIPAENDTSDGAQAISHSKGRPTSIFAPAQKPDQVVKDKKSVIWQWKVSLAPGQSTTVNYVVGCDATDDAALLKKCEARAQAFTATFEECRQNWETRWHEAFTAGNAHFSGYLPVLQTDDDALRRSYYMSVLTVLDCERSQYKTSPRDFVTEPDRPGKQYFWDASMMATVWSLLEPQGMKTSLRFWLCCDLMNSHGFNIGSERDMNPGWYAFSGANVFYSAITYLKVTGDMGFLDEKLPLGMTVLQRLDDISLLWKQRLAPGQALVNWTSNRGILLESAAPAYQGCVASLNCAERQHDAGDGHAAGT